MITEKIPNGVGVIASQSASEELRFAHKIVFDAINQSKMLTTIRGKGESLTLVEVDSGHLEQAQQVKVLVIPQEFLDPEILNEMKGGLLNDVQVIVLTNSDPIEPPEQEKKRLGLREEDAIFSIGSLQMAIPFLETLNSFFREKAAV
jgi:hypothetical protein